MARPLVPSLHRRNRAARGLAATLLLPVAAAVAQVDGDNPVAIAPPASMELEPTTHPTVFVVGSRIRRVDHETSQPVLTLGRADIERTGLTAVGDVMQQIVIHGSDLNTRINNGGNGETRVSLRHLGSNRSLVLVNGRRWIPTLDGAVDLGTIPLAIVDRIEVLKDGASAIYGSDAIAGVVNIMTRDYDGAEVNAYLGGWEQGDGFTRAYDATVGRAGDRGGFALNASYTDQAQVMAGHRAQSAVPVHGLPANSVPPASGATPFGQFRIGRGGPVVALTPGRPGTAPGDFHAFDDARDGYNYAPANYLLTPHERGALYAQGRWRFTDRVEFSGELLYSRRRSSQRLAPAILEFYAVQGDPPIAAENVYNPFGLPVVGAVRRLPEAGPRDLAEDSDTWRLNAGFSGEGRLFGRLLYWDVNAIGTGNRVDTTLEGFIRADRFEDARGPSFFDASGAAHCGTPDAPIPGCVPVNLFGGPGSVTADMLGYLGHRARDRNRITMAGLGANLAGDLFDLRAGPLAFSAGLEHRRERGENIVDPVKADGLLMGGGTTNLSTPRGGYSVSEAYLELNVPLLVDRRFARLLDVDLAARHSRYSSFGTTTRSKFGFRWKPSPALLLRGSYSQGFRAPSVADLYLGRIDAFTGVLDPCDAARRPGAATLARCRADGVPEGHESRGGSAISLGGEPDLRPEVAQSRTLGVVYGPPALPGLDLSLDWYRFRIHDPISNRTANDILDACYLSGDARSCERITRDADGQVVHVLATNENLPGGLEVEGFDFTVDYRRSTRWGDFSVGWDSTYIDYYGELGRPRRLERLRDGALAVGNQVGNDNVWRIKTRLTLAWERGAWSASMTARYFSHLDEDCRIVTLTAETVGEPGLRRLCSDPDRIVDLDGDGIGDDAPQNRMRSAWFLDLQASWETPWNARIVLGANNALDRNAPVSYTYDNSQLPDYDIPGRFWYLGYRQRF